MDRKASQQAGSGLIQACWNTTSTLYGFACIAASIPELDGSDLSLGAAQAGSNFSSQGHSQQPTMVVQQKDERRVLSHDQAMPRLSDWLGAA